MERGLFRRRKEASTDIAVVADRAPVRMSRELKLIGEHSIDQLGELPLGARPGIVDARIRENLTALLLERDTFQREQKGRLDALASFMGEEGKALADPYAIEARIAIWEALAQEHAVIAAEVAGILREEERLITVRRGLDNNLQRHETELGQTRNLLQNRVMKAQLIEDGHVTADPLSQQWEKEWRETELPGMQAFIAESPFVRAEIISKIATNEVDLKNVNELKYFVGQKLVKFLRNRFNPELIRCNTLRDESIAEIRSMMQQAESFWGRTKELRGVNPDEKETKKAIGRHRKETVGRKAIEQAADDLGGGVLAGLLSRAQSDPRSEAIVPSAIQMSSERQ